MLDKAKQLIQKYAFGKRVAAAVSGGEDSMALLSLLLQYHKAGVLTLWVVNVDHCLRAESASDSLFVKDYCKNNGIEYVCERVDIPALKAKSGRGTESEAHFARKEIFDKIISSGTADIVATAHHARDNAETVLFHLFRGAGLKGLGGMKILSGALFRPFLTTPKEEICEYVHYNNIKFVTDKTNADTDYDRNYIRHELLPRIRARFPAAERAICRAAAAASYADEYIASQICDGAVIKNDDGSVSVDEKYLSAQCIFYALELLGKTKDVYSTAIESVQKLTGSKLCAKADIGDGIVAAREYGKVTFYYDTATESFEPIPLTLPEERAVFRAGKSCVVTEKVDNVIPDKKTLYFDADKLPENCVWRTRKEGDRFTPYGGGSRKLKEYLIDNKVPKRLRDDLIMLCSDSEVLLIADKQISDKIKVSENSKRIYCVYTESVCE